MKRNYTMKDGIEWSIVIISLLIVANLLFSFFVIVPECFARPTEKQGKDFECALTNYINNDISSHDYDIVVKEENGKSTFSIGTVGIKSKLILNIDGTYEISTSYNYIAYYVVAIILTLFFGFALLYAEAFIVASISYLCSFKSDMQRYKKGETL